jgi:cell division protease FtsH
LGGRASEEIVFNEITTGASNDLERATKLARSMVTQYGMSDKLGPRTFGEKEELVFLGKEIGEQRNYSEEVARAIDSEVRNLIEEAHSRAKSVLSAQRATLDAVAQKLIEVESIDSVELNSIIARHNTPAPSAA